MRDGFLRAAALSPDIRVADCKYNANEIKKAIDAAFERQVQLLVTPELGVSAYTCGDLFLQSALLEEAERGILEIAAHTRGRNIVVVAGFPAKKDGRLYNAAAVMTGGEILGVVPKSAIPNYSEFYEARHFSRAPAENSYILLGGREIPFGTKLLFRCRELPEFTLGVEICEDLFIANSPSAGLALAGATVIANLSASDELVCKPRFRRELVKIQSAKLVSAYVYAGAGEGESTTDLVFSGHDMISENGLLLAESAPFKDGFCETEIDLFRISAEKRRTGGVRSGGGEYEIIDFDLELRDLELTRRFDKRPFIPADSGERAERCEDILNIQSAGLEKRLKHIGAKTAVLGISGGLDSTLALLVTARAFDRLGLPREGIRGISMPCFGTTERTKSNAQI
ncbi:MAG: nitrilase-related carbon-nitrogen hydrolase, partial [Oscillospiraceae bacterium]|nr:nitrilase-related carbon-nitrogen hydrolase [Oscillospiraceae bacterium]